MIALILLRAHDILSYPDFSRCIRYFTQCGTSVPPFRHLPFRPQILDPVIDLFSPLGIPEADFHSLGGGKHDVAAHDGPVVGYPVAVDFLEMLQDAHDSVACFRKRDASDR